jgi:hypothetical protein
MKFTQLTLGSNDFLQHTDWAASSVQKPTAWAYSKNGKTQTKPHFFAAQSFRCNKKPGSKYSNR